MPAVLMVGRRRILRRGVSSACDIQASERGVSGKGDLSEDG